MWVRGCRRRELYEDGLEALWEKRATALVNRFRPCAGREQRTDVARASRSDNGAAGTRAAGTVVGRGWWLGLGGGAGEVGVALVVR